MMINSTFRKLTIILCLLTITNWLKAADFNCALTSAFSSGNWNNVSTWTLVSGTDADGIPDADDNITITTGRVIVNVNCEVNNITVAANNNIHITLPNAITLRVFGRLDTQSGGNFTGEAPIQGETLNAGTLEFAATTTRTAISSFYGNTYVFGNLMPKVNFGTSTASSNTLTIGAFQSGGVVVRNCSVNIVDHYYIGNSENVTIESTGIVYQDQVAGATFGFANSSRNFNGINNFTINGTFRTGNNIAAANVIVNSSGTLVVSNAANTTGLRASNYIIDGTLEYNTTNNYTAGAELTGISSRTLGSLKLTGGLVTLPDLISAQTWTLNNSLTIVNGKLNLFEHTLNFADAATTSRTGTGYVIAQANGSNNPKMTANLTVARSQFFFHIGTSNAYTLVYATPQFNINTLPTSISASMYAAYAACGTGNADLTKSVNLAYNVTSSNAAQDLVVEFHYATAAASTLRGAAYVPANAKIVGCSGNAYTIFPGGLNIGEYASPSLGTATYYGRAVFGGINTPLDGRRIMISSDNAIIGNPPTISAVSTSGITATAATVNYTVNANGNSTTTQVRYGLAANNLNQTATGSTATGSTNTQLNLNLTGLTASTQYFYSVEATNQGGSATPVTGSFTTTSTASLAILSGISVNGITATNATVNYTVTPNAATVQTVVYYGTSSSSLNNQSNIITSTSTSSLANTITGLNPNTLYYFRVDAVNTAGTTSSSVGTFTTTNGPILTTVTANTLTTNSANISYQLNANGSNTTSLIRWGTSSTSLTNTVVGTSATGNTTISANTPISGLSAGTQYFYLVEATNATGTSQSLVGSFTTAQANQTPIITNITANGITNTTATISYTVNINSSVPSISGSSRVEYGTSSTNLNLFSNTVTTTGTGSPSHNLTGLSSGTTYYYVIRADNFQFSTISAQGTFTTTGVAVPLTLTKFEGTLNNNQALLSWQTSQESNTSHFDIEYSNNGSIFSKVKSVDAAGNSLTSKNYSISHNISSELNHYYRLKMVDKDGNFSYSSIVRLKSATKRLEVLVYPTIVSSTTTISIQSAYKGLATIKLVSIEGKLIQQQNLFLQAGSQTITLPTSSLQKGVYKVLVQANEQLQNVTIIKQ